MHDESLLRHWHEVDVWHSPSIVMAVHVEEDEVEVDDDDEVDEADDDDLEDDPELLVAEVEEFLRDVD